jgi:hypothetical protein
MGHVLHCEGGHYGIKGADVRGTLGAPYTGRSVDVDSAYGPARAWMDAFEAGDPGHLVLEKQFRAAVASATVARFSDTAFRGLKFQAAPTSHDFGPPRTARGGRYNAQGISVLYLCSSEFGVVQEVGRPPAGRSLWIQRFTALGSLAFFDARTLSDDSFAAGVFWVIEQQRDRTKGPSPLGARVGEIVGETFDGMIVPGVRGDTQLYSNIILFRPQDRWRTLVDLGSSPRLVP